MGNGMDDWIGWDWMGDGMDDGIGWVTGHRSSGTSMEALCISSREIVPCSDGTRRYSSLVVEFIYPRYHC